MIKRISPTAIGRWSTRRPVLAIAAWLTFVIAAVVALSLTGSKPLDNGAVGQSARGYALMDSHRLGLPPNEYVYLHSDSVKTGSPAFRTAIESIDRAMRAAIGRGVSVELARDQHSALVSATVTRPFDEAAVNMAVAAVGAAHPGVSAIVVDPTSGGG